MKHVEGRTRGLMCIDILTLPPMACTYSSEVADVLELLWDLSRTPLCLRKWCFCFGLHSPDAKQCKSLSLRLRRRAPRRRGGGEGNGDERSLRTLPLVSSRSNSSAARGQNTWICPAPAGNSLQGIGVFNTKCHRNEKAELREVCSLCVEAARGCLYRYLGASGEL